MAIDAARLDVGWRDDRDVWLAIIVVALLLIEQIEIVEDLESLWDHERS